MVVCWEIVGIFRVRWWGRLVGLGCYYGFGDCVFCWVMFGMRL